MKKSRFTNVLMISSLAGLIAFLAWWNVKNYHQQKEQLVSDLTTQFELARGRYNDSLIIQIFEVVDFRFPDTLSLNEPKNQKSVTSAFTRVSFSAETNEMDSLFTSQSKDGLISLSLSTQGELNRDTSFSFLDSRKGKFPEMLSFDDLTVNDSGVYDVSRYKQGGPLSFTFTDESQVEFVAKYAAAFLDSTGLPDSFTISDITDADSSKYSRAIIVPVPRGIDKSQTRGFVFTDYHPYLYRNIADELLISTFLFGLVACSFYYVKKASSEEMKAASLKSQFIANMTHELKTPISTVGVALESMQKYGASSSPEKMEEYIDISKGELSRLEILVDKVLKMSAVSDELQALNASKIDLKVLAEGVVKSMKLYLEQYGMEVNLSVIGSHFFVLADQIHVTNVIYNLIENAVKYRGENKEIHVKLTEESDTIRVRVADGGIGIPKKYHNQVFERFFRVPTEDRHNVKGYGLGLHYAYNVIKQLGGKMSFTSVENKGSEFSFDLPKA